MEHISLYRKYRPVNFDNIIGQDNIVNILENTIKSERISHAYLFNGPRGTGKTSIAKIFAQMVNCTCEFGECILCNKEDNSIPDIWEIDAASNNGVEEIRKIVDNVNYLPIELKYKIYIIDEVHMLSKGAFNALLKTLEEPPKHVIFILATTEIYKIPLTIISRCQRFDFKRISSIDIVKRLTTVLNNEKIEYDDQALELIAKLADGGMRDALSLVDKVSLCQKKITLESINKSLQLVSDDHKQKLLDLIIEGDIKSVACFWNEILAKGVDENKFIIDMQYYIRDLLINNSSDYSKQKLLQILKSFSDLDSKLNFTKNYALVVEIYLIDMCSTDVPLYVNEPIIKPKVEEPIIDLELHLENLKKQTENLKVNEPIVKEVEAIPPLEVIVEPIEQQENKMETKIECEKLTYNQIDAIDVLSGATKELKSKVKVYLPKLKLELEKENKFGLSKFFDFAQPVAVAKIGIIFAIEQEYYESYSKRLEELECIIYKSNEKKCKIFLLEKEEWRSKRTEFIDQMKKPKSNDVFKSAKETFPDLVINKI